MRILSQTMLNELEVGSLWYHCEHKHPLCLQLRVRKNQLKPKICCQKIKLTADSQPLYRSGKKGGTVLYLRIEKGGGGLKIAVCRNFLESSCRAPVHLLSQLLAFSPFLPLSKTFLVW